MSTTLPENTDTNQPLKVADIVITDNVDILDNDGNIIPNTLSLTGADADKFEIINNSLYLKAGIILDYEDKNQYQVTINIDDPIVGSNPDRTLDYTLTVEDVNEAPGIILEQLTNSIAESADTSTRIKVGEITIYDDQLGTNELTLTGDDADKFEIDGNSLYLKAGVELNYASQNQYFVTVNVDDVTINSTPEGSVYYTLTVNPVPEIQIRQSDNVINSDTNQDFGTVNFTSGVIEKTFIIENVGNAVLDISNMTISGVNASDFTLTVEGRRSVSLQPAESTTIKVQFKPTGEGERNATLTINNNDSDENAYTINLTGTGTIQTAVTGSNDNDNITNSGTNTTVNAGGGNDTVTGSNVGESITAGDGNDTVNGGGGNDRIYGDAGNDTLEGGLGNDYLQGGIGDDYILGNEGNDYLLGDDGNDTLDGGIGSDRLRGGRGSDTFVISNDSGTDIILDFNLGEDHLQLNGITKDQLSFETVGRYAHIIVEGKVIARLLNITAEGLMGYFDTRYSQ